MQNDIFLMNFGHVVQKLLHSKTKEVRNHGNSRTLDCDKIEEI